MILCAGLQSGGTTLASWCFLQRADCDGVLDMKRDVLQTDLSRATQPLTWVKMTVSSFRWLEVQEQYRDMGWAPEPLLIVRDVRSAFASLQSRSYGFNGTTAEDPPLRMRFRRFLLDWQLFRENDWPILKFEELVIEPDATLQRACEDLHLPWDDAMVKWPKSLNDIAYVGTPNRRFASSIVAGNLHDAIDVDALTLNVETVPPVEHAWLEEMFADYNRVHGYPEHLTRTDEGAESTTAFVPSFDGTRRAKVRAAVSMLTWISDALAP
jgi:hypothetical protein